MGGAVTAAGTDHPALRPAGVDRQMESASRQLRCIVSPRPATQGTHPLCVLGALQSATSATCSQSPTAFSCRPIPVNKRMRHWRRLAGESEFIFQEHPNLFFEYIFLLVVPVGRLKIFGS